jgi:hypothetical protein
VSVPTLANSTLGAAARVERPAAGDPHRSGRGELAPFID